jgi:hypothetical protein
MNPDADARRRIRDMFTALFMHSGTVTTLGWAIMLAATATTHAPEPFSVDDLCEALPV